MADRHEYTVCFLFSPDLSEVLLARKNATDFAGRLNGTGGDLEPGETPAECALREILEETGVAPEDMKSLGLVRMAYLGTLELPHDCKYNDGRAVLHYFAGALKNRSVPREATDKGEALVWEPVSDVLGATVSSARYAGNGDVPYFVNAGLAALGAYIPKEATDV